MSAIRKDKSALMAKLVRLAMGNVELVDDAIRSATQDDKPADLEKIVKYIVAHRDERRAQIRQPA
jgi:glycerol-3-phosphate cytidylyltransferase-like family protein